LGLAAEPGRKLRFDLVGATMNLVRITAPTDTLRALHDIDGLDTARGSLREAGENQWTLSGYATDDAVVEIRARGATVDILQTDAEIQPYLDQVAQVAEEAARETGEA
jgi:hypothetical protein